MSNKETHQKVKWFNPWMHVADYILSKVTSKEILEINDTQYIKSTELLDRYFRE